jgi:hypothetical protein
MNYRVSLHYYRGDENYYIEKHVDAKELLNDTLRDVASKAKELILIARSSSQISFVNFNGAIVILRDTTQYSAVVTYGKQRQSRSSNDLMWTALDDEEIKLVHKYLNANNVYGLENAKEN